ncbi:hypothetical protein RchiOBHm_Chr1g0373191 [Rosa chinensis]|uniref:HVA22-like protein n=1 Tax=Rosa chinensis TaxID=74649 RepID=A0A2P6SM15_ROSCH|nr:uncharacterized protein LOC112171351 [Rosa chinensis]PRQ59709.1 hypothetical protein RchiOBHm_Chr1g0373191 [Rosa chinensis]
MGKAWFLLTKLHSLAWPGLTLAYPLYASMMAMEGGDTSKPDVQQWLAYWIMYALLSPLGMILQPLLQWIPFCYDVKLVLVAWLVLPQFGGARFLYEKYVRDHALRLIGRKDHPRHQVATSRPFQPAPGILPNAGDTSTHRSNSPNAQDASSHQSYKPNARDTSTHPSNTPNARDASTHQSNTANVRDTSTHPSNIANTRDTSTRVGRMSSTGGGENRVVHKLGKLRSTWKNLARRHTRW